MVKIYAVNGSPRKKEWNTFSLLESALKGAKSAGADTEIINLYDYTYKGCISCLTCKIKGNKTGGICAYKDELTPILEKLRSADGIIFGSPIYFSSTTGQFRAFIERLCFPLYTYMVDKNGNGIRVPDKDIPTGIIYTMNCPEELAQKFHYPELLNINKLPLQMIYGDCEDLWAYDTYQFSDYSKYDCNMFSADNKLKRRQEHFPIDMQNAYKLGEKIAQKAKSSNN